MKLKIYIRKIKFTFNKQYLFGLLFSRNAKKTHTDQYILRAYLLCLKKTVSQTFKSNSCKKVILQECISMIHLTTMNVLYSMR